MVNEFENIKNYNIAVKKHGDDITFLRRIVPGASDDSYGIEVAKLAGLPQSIIGRAKEILKAIESGDMSNAVNHSKNEKQNFKEPQNAQSEPSKVCINENKVIEKLKNLDVSVLTPIESMNILYDLARLAGKA
jgi:DNA mismatch repair protein MutS